MTTRNTSKDSPPLVYINPRPPAPIPPQHMPTYSPRSSSHGHGTSGSISGGIILGSGRESPPPATPLSPRPCVSRKASANRIIADNNSSTNNILGLGNTASTSSFPPGARPTHQSAQHRRSLSSAVSMTSFPVVKDRDVMTTFGTAPRTQAGGLPAQSHNNSTPASASQNRSAIFTHSRANKTLDDAAAAVLSAAFSPSRSSNHGHATTADAKLTPSTPTPTARTQPPTPASQNSRRAATYGIASGANLLGSSAMSDSHHNSSNHLHHSTSSLMGSPSTKKITLANQWAATQELKEWGSNFWVVISDPSTGHSFFANPHTGECKWEVPTGTFVLPPNPDGQWMEFFDEQHDLPYFFHSGQNRSQWERPPGFVIPLTTIQEVNMGRPFGGPAGAKRTPRVSISSDGGRPALGFVEEGGPATASAADNSGTSAEKGTNSMDAGSSPGRTSITFAEPSKAEKRKSIQPPPPTQKPSIDQVLAYRRSISLGKSELLARALASNGIGIGAPYGSSEKQSNDPTSILNSPGTNEAKLAGGGGGGSSHQRRESESGENNMTPSATPPSSPPRMSISSHTTIRKVLGPKLLSDEMEHISDIPTPLSQISENQREYGGGGRPYVPPPKAASAVTEKDRDDTASISSAGTDFMMHLASGRLFGSQSAHGHHKTNSGASGYTVSGPGGGGAVNGGGNGSIRDSVASSFSRSSSALGGANAGGFAPIAEENGTTGIIVKVTRPSTSTDGASLASKSGRWTPEFGGSVSSWRRDVSWGEGGSSTSDGGASGSAGTSGGGGGGPVLRERESLRNMRSPPSSGRTAAVVSAQASQNGNGGSSSMNPAVALVSASSSSSSLAAFQSPQSSGELMNGAGAGGSLLSPPQMNGMGNQAQSWDSGVGSGSGGGIQPQGAGATTWSTSSWRTNSGASAGMSASAAAAAAAASARGSSPASSHSWHHSSSVGGSAFKSGLSRFGGGGGVSTPSSSFHHSSNGGGMEDASYDSGPRSLGHGIGNVTASPTPVKSPKLFNALRFKLRNASSSSSSHAHNSPGSATNHSTRERSFELQGVMHIADRNPSSKVDEDDNAPAETPEEAYNRRRLHSFQHRGGPGGSSTASSVVAAAATSGGGGGPHAIPSRSGSLGAMSLHPANASSMGSTPPPPLPQLSTVLSPTMTNTPNLSFSPHSLTSPSLGSDSSHQHNGGNGAPSSTGVLAGSYGLGVGLPNGNGGADGKDGSSNGGMMPMKREPFRPSGVTDVVLHSRHTSPMGSPFEADPPGGAAGARTKDPQVSAFDAMLKGYTGTESQVIKRVKASVETGSSHGHGSLGGDTSPPPPPPPHLGRKWF
ncbi:hypothetical protein CF319_g5831 [Tilletia indica]|nr:hypothetical protein CF319_g5831 [Tilletia indica]